MKLSIGVFSDDGLANQFLEVDYTTKLSGELKAEHMQVGGEPLPELKPFRKSGIRSGGSEACICVLNEEADELSTTYSGQDNGGPHRGKALAYNLEFGTTVVIGALTSLQRYVLESGFAVFRLRLLSTIIRRTETEEDLKEAVIRAVKEAPIGYGGMIDLIDAITKQVQHGDMPEQLLKRIERASGEQAEGEV